MRVSGVSDEAWDTKVRLDVYIYIYMCVYACVCHLSESLDVYGAQLHRGLQPVVLHVLVVVLYMYTGDGDGIEVGG